jgi:hypothetical protein
MIYVTTWTFKPEHRDAIQARFKQTGGLPPEGVRMLGRWHGIGLNKGVCVAENDDPLAIGRWAQQWSDLMSLEMYPALTDEDTAKILP